MIEIETLPVRHGNVPLRVARGHFATNHSHINYYIDITNQKVKLNEARDMARQMVANFINNTPVETILCLDGMTVIGTCLAQELTKNGFQSMNENSDIYVIEPEYNANSQMIFRDNIQALVRNKHVLVLMASVTTGFTAHKGIEAVGYYGGEVVGIASLYSVVGEINGLPVRSVYNLSDIPDYASYDYKECPYCKKGRKLDALVNSFGYSSI